MICHLKTWIDTISQKSFGHKAAYLCIISFFMIAIFYFFIGNRQRIELARLVYKSDKFNEKIHEIKSVLVKPKALYNQINQLKIIEKKLKQQFDIDFNFLSLLYALSQIDSDLALTYLAIHPREQINFGYYSTFTIHISIIGRFQQLILYISKLFDLNLLMTVDEFQITPIIEKQNINNAYVSENGSIGLEMTILVYRFE